MGFLEVVGGIGLCDSCGGESTTLEQVSRVPPASALERYEWAPQLPHPRQRCPRRRQRVRARLVEVGLREA